MWASQCLLDAGVPGKPHNRIELRQFFFGQG